MIEIYLKAEKKIGNFIEMTQGRLQDNFSVLELQSRMRLCHQHTVCAWWHHQLALALTINVLQSQLYMIPSDYSDFPKFTAWFGSERSIYPSLFVICTFTL